MHKFYEYLEDYNVRYVLDSFLDDKENGIDRQNWSPLIPANQYQQALPVGKDSLTHIGFWWSILSFNNGGSGVINRPISRTCKFFIRYM